jgi:hypothetical protein
MVPYNPLPALRTQAAKLRLCTSVRCLRGDSPLTGVLDPKAVAEFRKLRGQRHGQLKGTSKWKEANASLAKRVPKQSTRTNGAAVQTAASRVVTPKPSAKLERLGSGWNHVVRGGRVVKGTLTTTPETAPRPVVEVPQKDKTTELNTGSNSAYPVLKFTEAFRQAQVTSTKVKSGKSLPKNPNPTKQIPPPQSCKSPFEEIFSRRSEISSKPYPWAPVWS